MFFVDDDANQPLADAYGVVAGSSHIGNFPIPSASLIHTFQLQRMRMLILTIDRTHATRLNRMEQLRQALRRQRAMGIRHQQCIPLRILRVWRQKSEALRSIHTVYDGDAREWGYVVVVDAGSGDRGVD